MTEKHKNRYGWRILYSGLWAFASALAFPQLIADGTLLFSNSVFSILLFAAVFALLYSESRRELDRRRLVCTHLAGLLFAAMTAFGYSLKVYGSVRFGSLVLPVLLYTHVFACFFSLLWKGLACFESQLDRSGGRIRKKLDAGVKWFREHPVCVALLFILCWLPAFLAEFPGGFRYDAAKEFAQVTDGYRSDLPLLHSAIITKLLPFLHGLTGSYNTGVAVYVVLQMILLASIYTHMFCVFAGRKVNSGLLLAAFLYCGFFPVIQMLAVQSVRDVLFSTLLMYSVFWLYLYATDREGFFRRIRNPLLASVTFVLAVLARNNNLGAVALVVILLVSLLFWIVNRKKFPVASAVFSVSCAVLYLLLSVGLTFVCRPLVPTNRTSALSLVFQSITRSYLQDEWSPEDVQELSEYMDLEDPLYVPENADGAWRNFRFQDGKGKDFLVFWARMGLKHPGTYLEAALAGTQDMWFPSAIVDGYIPLYKKEGLPYWEWEKSYFYIDNTAEAPVQHANLLPALLEFYTRIGLEISFEKIPVISMLFSIGFQFWTLLNALFYLAFRKHGKLLPSVCVLLLYMLLSALTPLVILRYYAAVFFCVPMLLVFTLQPGAAENVSGNRPLPDPGLTGTNGGK